MTALLAMLFATAALIIAACVLVHWRRRVLERRAWQERQNMAWWA